jgi:DNA damage-inducible protein 1
MQVDGEATLDTLKATLEAETKVPQNVQLLLHNGAPLHAASSLAAQGVQAGDLLLMERAAASPNPSAGGGLQRGPSGAGGMPSAEEAQRLLQQLRSMPQERLPPPLREAVASGDISTILKFVEEMSRAQNQDPFAEEEAKLMAAAAADPFNIDVQRRLEELIQQKNVFENYSNAMEYNPEAFASVHMLYVNTSVNGKALKAFVDSGAQMTIMSHVCAEECGLLRLMDKRFQGLARGVGQQRILGRIHMAPCVVAGKHIPISISVLEGDNVNFILGLDNLKRHQCSIDLKDNVLRFGSLDVAIPFLAEHELPKDDLFNKKELEEMEEAAEKAKAAGEAAVAAGGGGGTGAAGSRVISPSAPAPTSSLAPTPAAPTNGQLPAGWEEKVDRLIALGFPRLECVDALNATNGNEEMAGSLLFGGF